MVPGWGAGPAGDRRGDDGPRRAARDAADDAAARAGGGDGMADDPGADRARGGAAAWRADRYLLVLAVDLRYQCADRDPGHHRGDAVHRGLAGTATRSVRYGGSGSVGAVFVRADVWSGDGRPWRDRAGAHLGDGGGGRGRGRGILAACTYPCSAAAGFIADAAADIRGGDIGDVAVPDGDRGDSVPVAADAAGGVRGFGGTERADYVRELGWGADHEAGGAAGAAVVRVPQHADLERRVVGGAAGVVRRISAGLAGCGDLCGAADRRVL